MERLKKAIEMAEGWPKDAGHPPVVESGAIHQGSIKTINVDPKVMQANKIACGFINSPLADSYKLLRTRVIERMRANKWKTLGITGPSAKVGKTLTAINLGIAIAKEPNHSVLLVDTDLRQPSVHKVFGLDIDCGLVDRLAGKSSLDDMLINPGVEGFDILPCLKRDCSYSELLTSPEMDKLLADLKLRYDSRLMLFDLPPILVSDDVLAFSKHLDAILVVVEDNKTLSNEFLHAMEIMEGVDMLGIVLNKSNEAFHESLAGYY